MDRIFAGFVISVAALLLGACGGGGSFSLGSSAPAPTDVLVSAGDSSATVSWTMAPGVDYWILLAPTDNITTANWTSFLGARSLIKAQSPQLVTALVNGTTYSFTVNGRVGNGAGGPGSPSQSIVPRIAGGNWTVGNPLSGGDLLGAGVGTALDALGTTTIYTFLAVGAGGRIFSSLDGKAWTARTSPTTADLRAAVFGGNYVAAGANGSIVTSADAVTWAAKTSNTGNTLNGIASNSAGTYVAVGANGSIVTSTDGGLNWTAAASGTTQNLNAVAFGSNGSLNYFVAVGDQGTLLSSLDGLSWTVASSAVPATTNLRGIAYAAVLSVVSNVLVTTPTWVAVGSGGSILTSNDAATWTTRSSGSGSNLNAATYNTRFVAAGNGGTILTSDDGGITWQAQASRTSANLAALAHSLYGYLAVGAAGTNLTSF